MKHLFSQVFGSSRTVALRELDLAGKRIRAVNTAHLLSKFNLISTIRKLSFQYCLDLTWDNFTALSDLVPGLQSLSIVKCPHLVNSKSPISGRFTSLTYFEAARCDFTFELASTLSGVSSLRHIILADVSIRSDEPLSWVPFFPSLSSLQSLETFRLVGSTRPDSRFQGCKFDGVGLLTRLKVLSLVIIDRKKKIQALEFPLCPSIERLRLGPTDGNAPPPGVLPSLSDLCVRGYDSYVPYSCKSFIQHFDKITSLQTYAVAFDWLDSPLVLPNLRRLSVASVPSQDSSSFQFLTCLHNLTDLNIGFRRDQFPNVSIFSPMTQLVSLGLRIEIAPDLEALRGLPLLTRLIVRASDSLSGSTWQARTPYSTSLRELQIDYYTVAFVRGIPRAFPRIAVLSLGLYDPMEHAPLESLLELKHLVSLKHFFHTPWSRDQPKETSGIPFGHPTATLSYHKAPTSTSEIPSWE